MTFWVRIVIIFLLRFAKCQPRLIWDGHLGFVKEWSAGTLHMWIFIQGQSGYYTLGKIGWTFALANWTTRCDWGWELTELSSTCVMRFCYSSADGLQCSWTVLLKPSWDNSRWVRWIRHTSLSHFESRLTFHNHNQIRRIFRKSIAAL